MTTTASPPGSAAEAHIPTLAIRDLEKTFPSGGMFSRRRIRAVHQVSFEIAPGEITALVGESGSGKSTIARMIARLEQADSGAIELAGTDVLKTEARRASRAFRGRVQMVFQDPFSSLNPVHRIDHFLLRPLAIHRGLHGEQAQAAARELFGTVGLRLELLHSYPHQLSGGQRQRVALARALAADPELIIADEPTSMLDVSVRIGVLNVLDRLRREQGIALLYITHDLASARYLCDSTLVMYAGELVEGGESLELMDNPTHPYTRLLLSAVPEPRRRERIEITAGGSRPNLLNPSPGCAFAPRCPLVMDVCRTVNPTRTQVGPSHWVRCHAVGAA